MGNNIPEFDTIHFFKFYNLHEHDWIFENTNTSIEHNAPIIDAICSDFVKTFDVQTDLVKAAFEVDYIHTNRSSEGILLLYTNKDDDKVFRYFTNVLTQTYKVLTTFN